jgi:hypothetical protein
VARDQLEPVRQLPSAWRKWRWRRAVGVPSGTAAPVYVVGVQRSGTHMLVEALGASPEVEVHNENDRRAFDRFELRADGVVREIVTRSRHRFVLFKPLCDSHRVDRLLDTLATPSSGKAIWAYRSVDARVRSAVTKFEDSNRQVLRQIAAGRGDGLWQAQGISAANLELIGTFDYETMTPESASALFWYVRNSLFFDLELERRPDVVLSSYDALVRDPETVVGGLCSFLGLSWSPRLVASVDRSMRPIEKVELDTRIRACCDALYERLEAARQADTLSS